MTKTNERWAQKEANRLMAEMDEFERAVVEGLPIKLATGRLVQVRVIELTRFVENGEVPNPLIPLVHQELYGDDTVGAPLEVRHERYMNSLKVAQWVTDNVLKEPVKGLFHSELFEIYNLANSPAKALARFRVQQAADVRDGEILREVGSNAEPTSGD